MKSKQSIIALKELVERLHHEGDMLCIGRQMNDSIPKFSFVFDARNLLDGRPSNVEESACTLARYFIDSKRLAQAEHVLSTLIDYVNEHSVSTDEALLRLYDMLLEVQMSMNVYVRAVETHRKGHALRVKIFGELSHEAAESLERLGRLLEHYSESAECECTFESRSCREQAIESLLAARDVYAYRSDQSDDEDVHRVMNLIHILAMHL